MHNYNYYYGHPYDCFPTGSMYVIIYNYILTRACVVYVVKEVASFRGARSINGRGANRTRARALRRLLVYMRPERKLLVAYVETGTNS